MDQPYSRELRSRIGRLTKHWPVRHGTTLLVAAFAAGAALATVLENWRARERAARTQ